MFKIRFFLLLFVSLFFLDSTIKCDYWDGYKAGYDWGYSSGRIDGVLLGVIPGIIIGAATVFFDMKESEKKANENKHVKQIIIIDKFIKDILYALKDVYENSILVENSLLNYYLTHNDNLEFFMRENNIQDYYTIGTLKELMISIKSLTHLYTNYQHNLAFQREISGHKQKVLALTNRLYRNLNQILNDNNREAIKVDTDLISFLIA